MPKSSKIILVVILLATLFLATLRLTESPPTWMDEGLIIQPAKNLAENGLYKVRIGPDEYISPSFISTSYPVTLPIALSFALFGTGLLQARAVMVVYILLLVIAVYILCSKYLTKTHWLWPLLLLITFVPLYGHGKNVLGEIPGLLFLVAALVCLYLLEENVYPRERVLAAVGLFTGLCAATKPVYLLFIGGVCVALVVLRRRLVFTPRDCAIAGLTFLIPMVLWLWVQFAGDSVSTILHFYLNPQGTDIAGNVRSQALAYFTQLQPAYFLALLAVWIVSVGVRMRRKADIAAAELAAVTFAVLVALAYLRTPGYYRYFFHAEVLALLYLASNLKELMPKLWASRLLRAALVLIMCLQGYQLGSHSWLASSYAGDKTALIKQGMSDLPDGDVLVYEAPELVTFIGTRPYYQYTTGVPSSESILPVLRGAASPIDLVLTKGGWEEIPDLAGFKEKKFFGPYVLLERTTVPTSI